MILVLRLGAAMKRLLDDEAREPVGGLAVAVEDVQHELPVELVGRLGGLRLEALLA